MIYFISNNSNILFLFFIFNFFAFFYLGFAMIPCFTSASNIFLL